MRFHLLALPTTQTTRKFTLCGFCQVTIRFAKMLKALGHKVLLYASEENEAPCDELITCITKDEQAGVLGGLPYQWASANNECGPLWERSNERMIAAIGERKEAGDFICSIGGRANKPVCDAHQDLQTIEYSIGYPGSFAPYRVYESQGWREADAHRWASPQRANDETIPVFFDPDEFTFREQKEPFALFVGRLIPSKGVPLACESAYAAGLPLKVIGAGDCSLLSRGAEYLGSLSSDERNEWMSKASVMLCPSQYFEPFGCVAVEAQLCGTPVICSDSGGFKETVEQGRTGFRCNGLREFVEGIKSALSLNAKYIRERAVANYSMHNLQSRYQQYFERILT